MTQVPVPLDRIFLDDLVVAPRSSTLHHGGGEGPKVRESPWWVFLACERLPGHLGAGQSSIAFRARTTSGRVFAGEVRIVDRRDDAYGTELILAGLRPLATPPHSDHRR